MLTAIASALNVQSYEIVSQPAPATAAEAPKAELPPEPKPTAATAPAAAPAAPAPVKEQSSVEKAKEAVEKVQQSAGGAQKQSLISVNLAKLDALHDIVGEIITTESMVISNPDLEGLELESFNKAARQQIGRAHV